MAQVDAVWTMVHQHLEKEMCRVRDEIRNYPAPIPACDAQFNYLLEEREALSSELARGGGIRYRRFTHRTQRYFYDI